MSNVMGVVIPPAPRSSPPDVELHALRERPQKGRRAAAFAILIAEREQSNRAQPLPPALGFADLAHLTHKCRRFSGLIPAAYVASHRPHANHIVVHA